MMYLSVVINPRDRSTGAAKWERRANRALRCAFVEEVPDDVDMNFGREGETFGRAPGRPRRPMSDQDHRVCGDPETFVANDGFGVATWNESRTRRLAVRHAIGGTPDCTRSVE